MIKRYCMINEIRPDKIDEYVQAHANPWPELLECLKDCGMHDELIFLFGNKAILYIEAEDIDAFINSFSSSSVGKKWLEKVDNFLDKNAFTIYREDDKSDKYLQKVFDFRQQTDGHLEQY